MIPYASAGPKTVLLVEDNPGDIKLIKEAFREQGVTADLYVVRDGKEALDFLFREGAYRGRNANHVPDVVLLDLNLPQLSGFDVLEALRERDETRHTPVVVLSGSGAQEDLERSYALGASSFVKKPRGLDEFLAAVERIACYWLQVNEAPLETVFWSHPPEPDALAALEGARALSGIRDAQDPARVPGYA